MLGPNRSKTIIIPEFATGFGIRRKISAYFLLKKFLNTIKYSQTFLCVNILSFFISVLKPVAKSGIIMTSNIGSDCFIERTDKGNIGFARESNKCAAMDIGSIRKKIHSWLTDEFRPEFINRIDEVIIFNPLSVENLIEIARTMIRNMPVKLIVTDEILRYVAENGYNPQFGARHLKRALKKLILDPIANMITENRCQRGDTIRVCLCDNCLSFGKERLS